VPRFAANITLLFTELPFLARFAAASATGFEAVECQLPYGEEADMIANELRTHRLRLILFNLPVGEWEAGERGIACHPDRVEEFRAGVTKALAYAKALDCPSLNCLAGLLPPEVTVAEARRTLLANLTYAAEAAAAFGRAVMVEPINGHDVPGYFVCRADEVALAIREVGAPNLRLQLDLYHTVREGDDFVRIVEQHGPLIGHVQIADVPGRHEPGTGGLDFSAAFAALERAGYPGWVGCEYNPRGATIDGLDWQTPYLTARRMT